MNRTKRGVFIVLSLTILLLAAGCGNRQKAMPEVPLSEMFGYATDLRSRTQGRGQFTMQFDHYAEVPKSVAEKVIGERAKKN